MLQVKSEPLDEVESQAPPIPEVKQEIVHPPFDAPASSSSMLRVQPTLRDNAVIGKVIIDPMSEHNSARIRRTVAHEIPKKMLCIVIFPPGPSSQTLMNLADNMLF